MRADDWGRCGDCVVYRKAGHATRRCEAEAPKQFLALILMDLHVELSSCPADAVRYHVG